MRLVQVCTTSQNAACIVSTEVVAAGACPGTRINDVNTMTVSSKAEVCQSPSSPCAGDCGAAGSANEISVHLMMLTDGVPHGQV